MNEVKIKPAVNKIYRRECLEALRSMPKKSVATVFFDPPYNVGVDFGKYKDMIPEDEYKDFMKSVIDECKRVSSRGIGVYVNWRSFGLFWQQLLPDAEPIIINRHYNNAVSPLGIEQHHQVILTTCEAVIPLKSVWNDIVVRSEGETFDMILYGHPAPTSLKTTARFIVYFSTEKEIVLDPFMGIGTTAIAATLLNRNFIGFELNKKYTKIAKKRLKAIRRDGPNDLIGDILTLS